MRARISHSCPTHADDEARAVAEALASGYHARGPRCEAFEQALAQITGMRYAHATSSGTTALALALMGCGVKPGDEVLVPSLTCAAVTNAVALARANAVLYDGGYVGCDPHKLAASRNRRARAIVVVASPLRGEDVGASLGLDAEGCLDGVPVIYDRCQQLAPTSAHRTRARAEVFSFYATKCISTGSGGAVTSEHASVIERVRDLNTHDKREHYDAPRFNFQFDDLRAAVGMVQLRKLADFVTRRAALAALYDRALGLDYAARAQGMGMVFRYLLPLSGERQTDHVAAHLAAQGIDAIRPVFRPLHRYHGRADDEFPLATEAWQRHLSLPLYPALRDGDAERVTREVQQAMGMGS